MNISAIGVEGAGLLDFKLESVEIKLEVEETNIDPDKLLKCEDKFDFVLEKKEDCDEKSAIKQESVERVIDGLDTNVESDPDDDFDFVNNSSTAIEIDKPFTCEFCNKSFSVKSNMKNHIQTIHQGITTFRFKCDKCDYNATQKISLIRHQKSVHGGQRFTCSHCDEEGIEKSFKWEIDLKRHIQSRHSTEKFNCDECEQVFNTKRYLSNHKRLVHQGKAFQCDQCEVKVTSRASLQMHIEAVHLNTKYQCEACEFQASWKNDLTRHVKEVHMRTRFKCKQCDYETPRNYLLSKHIKSKHAVKRNQASKVSSGSKSVKLEDVNTFLDLNDLT